MIAPTQNQAEQDAREIMKRLVAGGLKPEESEANAMIQADAIELGIDGERQRNGETRTRSAARPKCRVSATATRYSS